MKSSSRGSKAVLRAPEKQHRTAPYPPRNISVRFVNLNKNNWEEPSGSFPEDSFIKPPQDSIGRDRRFHFPEETPETPPSNVSSGSPPSNVSSTYHGLYYIITLVVVNGNVVTKPSRSITVLTKPLPVTSVSIYDYKPSPETGVLFEIHYPEKYNVFSRVNISYWEGRDFRTMLYKDFFKGKTVFNHWLPGLCYSNITFQLVSEATFNKSTLVEYSGVSHEPKQPP